MKLAEGVHYDGVLAAPIRNCHTCAHCVKATHGLEGEFDRCLRFWGFCEIAKQCGPCGAELKGWQPKVIS